MAIPTPDEIWADFNNDGSVKEPAKQDIRRWSRYVEALAKSAGMVTYVNKATMDADTTQEDGQAALIYADPVEENNFPTVWIWDDGGNDWIVGTDRIASMMALLDSAFSFVGGLTILNLLGATAGDVELEQKETNYHRAWTDPSGNVALGILKSDGKVYGNFAGMGGDSSQDAENLAASLAIRDQMNTLVTGFTFNLNIIIGYGQSRIFATEGWPALSKTPVAGLDNLMYGGSTRPTGNPTTTIDFDPVGGSATLQALKATVESGGGAILSDGTVAALAPGASNPGEDPLVAAANFARWLHLRSLGVASDPTHRWVVANASVPGMTIEQLSKGASPNLFNRIPDAVTNIIAAKGVGDTVGVTAIVINQGEFNYVGTFGGTTDKAAYKALLSDLIDDMIADTMALTGQAKPPIVLLYQTDGTYVKNATNMSIGMAQIELSDERDDVVLVGGLYPYTDKNGHLDPNGYRNMGVKGGEVLHRVTRRGEGWKPLRPISASLSGQTITVNFHVPEPPLVFDAPYVTLTPTTYSDKGFRVTDDNGSVSVNSATIVGQTQVEVALATTPTGTVYIWYGDETHAGGGNLRDSGSWVSVDKYLYSGGTGQYAGANIPALVDKPYGLANWCVGFRIQAS